MSHQRFSTHQGDLPTHAPNGAKIVLWEQTIHNAVREHHAHPPSAPTRIVTEWDGDDVATERTLSDEEFAAWQTRYDADIAKHGRTVRTWYTFGPQTRTLRVECEDGTTGEAVSGDGAEWHWTSYGLPQRRERG